MSRTSKILEQLRRYESRNVTLLDPDGTWPVVWARARGVHVWDVEGRKYLDLTAAFGVAAAGHANARVVRAGQHQMSTLLHAMGDVHPHALKAQLAQELSHITFERWSKASPLTPHTSRATAKTIFCNSGFEAVEAALKTALLATGRRSVIAFEGGYHGLGYGALNATHREHFRSRFQSQLGGFVRFAPFPSTQADLDKTEESLRGLFRQEKTSAVLVEPVQGRGGINVPPLQFLPLLRRLCDEHGALLIADEIYTGFGRTGRWFACEHSQTVPDLICLGKGLTGGFPLSVCVGRGHLMDAAWPASTGEAIHTSTFLGHPVGCAMALAQMAEIRSRKLVTRSAELGQVLMELLISFTSQTSTLNLLLPRGLGLMAGLELRSADGSPTTGEVMRILKAMLHRGFILLPEGEDANVIGFSPPLTISERQLRAVVTELCLLVGAPQAKLRKYSETVTRKSRGYGNSSSGWIQAGPGGPCSQALVKLSEIKQILAEGGIQLTRSLGQTFLHDGNQLRRIVEAAELKQTDQVLEIGPGLGPLTELLVGKAGGVLAIEKDQRLVEILRQRFAGVSCLTLLHDDALEFLRRAPRDWRGWKLVANLPYSVASPILVELAQSERRPQRMVVSLQWEVARRLMARAGEKDYGLLTLLMLLDYELESSFKIPASCFFPEPEVDSACVVLRRRGEAWLKTETERALFIRIVKRSFSQRRKMMFKLLKEDQPPDQLAAAFGEAGLTPQVRAEAVALEQFVHLTQMLA